MMSKLRQLNERHKKWIKKRGYVYSKPLFISFFIISFLGLVLVGYLDGFADRVYVKCPEYGAYCTNPLLEVEDCDHYCCTIDYLPPGSTCGEPVSWLGRNYSWLVITLFALLLLVNHLLFNKDYDFDKYWGDWK